jgi:hypothetical protein
MHLIVGPSKSKKIQFAVLVLECYPAFRGILLLLDCYSILALARVNKPLASIINTDTSLFQQLISRTYRLVINSSFLESKTREKPFRNLPCSAVAKYLHLSLYSFNPSHLAHLKSTRLSLPSFKKTSLLAFFVKSKLVFVSLLQQCSVFVSFGLILLRSMR